MFAKRGLCPTAEWPQDEPSYFHGHSGVSRAGSRHSGGKGRSAAGSGVGHYFFKDQNSRKPRPCEAMTVSGLTITSAVRQQAPRAW